MPEHAQDAAVAAPAIAAPEAGPALARSPAALALALQRSHGNAAVGRMILARNSPPGGVATPPRPPGTPRAPVAPPRQGDVADMDRAISEHMANDEFDDAARILNGFNQLDIDNRVRGYTSAQRERLSHAAHVNGGAAARIRRVADFENAVVMRSWEEAARAIDGYPDPARVEPRLRGLGPAELALLLGEAQQAGLAVAATVATVASSRGAELAAAVAGAPSLYAAALLNAISAADMATQIARLTPAQLFDVNEAARDRGYARVSAALSQQPSAGLIRAEGLDRTLREQLAGSDWVGAARTLLSYSTDDDRRNRLAWLHLAQADALAAHLRTAGPPALYQLVEARRIEKLGEDYRAALDAGRWHRALELLDAYNDADLLANAHDIRTRRGDYGVRLCTQTAATMWPDDNHRVRRILAFLPLESRTEKAAGNPGTNAPMSPGAAAGPAVAVPGGSVTTHANAMETGPGGSTGWFGNDYQGAEAQRTGWLQFLTREAEKFDATGASLGYETSVRTHAEGQEEERFWGTPDAPQWTIDTMGSAEPFYASSTTRAAGGLPSGSDGAHVVAPTRAAMWDHPGANQQVLNACFRAPGNADVATVEMRFIFHDYLVRGPEVLMESLMTVTYSATSATAFTGPSNHPGRRGRVSSLRPEHHAALIRRFPAWTFYPHG